MTCGRGWPSGDVARRAWPRCSRWACCCRPSGARRPRREGAAPPPASSRSRGRTGPGSASSRCAAARRSPSARRSSVPLGGWLRMSRRGASLRLGRGAVRLECAATRARRGPDLARRGAQRPRAGGAGDAAGRLHRHGRRQPRRAGRRAPHAHLGALGRRARRPPRPARARWRRTPATRRSSAPASRRAWTRGRSRTPAGSVRHERPTGCRPSGPTGRRARSAAAPPARAPAGRCAPSTASTRCAPGSTSGARPTCTRASTSRPRTERRVRHAARHGARRGRRHRRTSASRSAATSTGTSTTACGAGQFVSAYRTVVGTIINGAGHLHLSELSGERFLNPLRPGRPGAGAVDATRRRPIIGAPTLASRRARDRRGLRPAVLPGADQVPHPRPGSGGARLPRLGCRGARRDRASLRAARRRSTCPTPRAGWSTPPTPTSPAGPASTRAWSCIPRWDYRLAGGLAPPLPPSARGASASTPGTGPGTPRSATCRCGSAGRCGSRRRGRARTAARMASHVVALLDVGDGALLERRLAPCGRPPSRSGRRPAWPGRAASTAGMASMPSRIGIVRSSRTTSGCRRSAASMAAMPSAASPTTSIPGSSCSV